MNITWCVVHTQPLKESIAQKHLLDQGYEVYFPRFKKVCRHARRVEEKLVPLFPRYIFLGLDLNLVRWRSINGTRGVSYLLMCDALNPAQVEADVIYRLQEKEIGDGIVPISSLVNFVKGEKVRILEGAFADQTGIFQSIDDNSRAQVLLTFLGREIKMSLPVFSIEEG
ncbi:MULTISPECIES: transcription termination/antitermination NusG family protein [Holospora]|nr:MULTISPECIES: transcription termination/antitermination NusG family protein [Holospora]